MRALADAARVRRFLRELGTKSRQEIRVYLTGGATAVLYGWRPTTLDVDIKIIPDSDAVLQLIPELKESVQINVELAAPDQFIPELPGWQERSPFVAREGKVSVYHYDLYAQALAKIERGHARDLGDAEEMVRRGLVDPAELLRLFGEIEPKLYRFPAIDAPSFRRRVEGFVTRQGTG
jgi:hypothetical protein